jgi:hypothetical protein
MNHCLLLLVGIVLFAPMVAFGQPDWAKRDTFKLISKNELEVVCQASGPSVQDARERAVSECTSTASQYISKDVNFKSLTIETETDVAVHNQVTYENKIKNLTCKPLNESIEEKEAQFDVWIRCGYSLGQAKVDSTGKDKGDAHLIETNTRSKPYRISVSSVPPCTSILVQGALTKTFSCKSNPTVITANANDKALIIRANGKKSKTVPLPLKEDGDSGDTKFIDVLFDEE